ncbi:hypothetical protein [Streptomyces sp. NPDC003077]|uniref:hypothetical protein n=1 Tax=Streptomyces sp. NPDC003077 TaxID=3154443 RepID=UPI0033B91D7A
MTTTPPSPAPQGRALGRGVSQLIPQQDTAASPAEQARAALAALKTVPVHIAVLQAAVLLLDDPARTAADETALAAARETVALLRAALDQAH